MLRVSLNISLYPSLVNNSQIPNNTCDSENEPNFATRMTVSGFDSHYSGIVPELQNWLRLLRILCQIVAWPETRMRKSVYQLRGIKFWSDVSSSFLVFHKPSFDKTFGDALEEREKVWWKKICLAAVGFGAIATLIYQQSTGWRFSFDRVGSKDLHRAFMASWDDAMCWCISLSEDDFFKA